MSPEDPSAIRLLGSILRRAASGEAIDFDALCAEHPARADELRELEADWESVRRILRGVDAPAAPRTLSERIASRFGPGADPSITLEGEADLDFATEVMERLAGHAGAGSRYRLKGEVGRGGMGAILHVWDEDLRRHLAMKVILAKIAAPRAGPLATLDSKHLARFLEEAQVTSQLDHPGIVPVHDLGLDADGRVYFTMKLVRGHTLEAAIELAAEQREGWSRVRALEIVLKICDAMAYAHDKGVLHRDLKPANVMVGRFGAVYVMDWGLARVLGRADDKDVRIREPQLTTGESRSREPGAPDPDSPLLTMDGEVVGTPAYMSPEQAAGHVKELGRASDVYAVGAILYHVLAGHMPYSRPGRRTTNYDIWRRVREGPPESLHLLAPEVPAELVSICEKAMAREPTARYSSMETLAEDLRAFLDGRVVRAYETGAWAEARKWVRRNKPLAASLAAALALLAAGLVTSVLLRQQAVDNMLLAEEQARIATDRADDVLRLSALQDLEDLLADADDLWPPHPEHIAGYRLWIERAQALVADLPLHRAKRAELRSKALPQSREERDAERVSHPDYGRWKELEGELAQAAEAAATATTDEEARAADEALIALEEEWNRVGARLDERREWRFPPEYGEARWWNAQLTKLIVDLEALTEEHTGLLVPGAVSEEHGWSVPRRLAFAERMESGFAAGGELARRWDSALPAIREAYAGLDVVPQMGLVPIGQDPASGLWEFWHVATGAEPARDRDGKVVLTEEMGVVLVLIPGGTFWMGAQTDPARRNYDPSAVGIEGPVHEVRLSPYFLSKYELTQGQWERITGSNPSAYGPEGQWSTTWIAGGSPASLLHPVEQVSWLECTKWLPRMGLALPSEAQWEHGARAGSDTVRWSGSTEESLIGVANLGDSYAFAHGAPLSLPFEQWLDDGATVHAPVGTYAANRFGLHDVLGNVWEWCLDDYEEDFYGRAPLQDPVALDTGSGGRVNRGGGFLSTAASARSAPRSSNPPSNADDNLGVRPARAVDE